MKKVWMVPTEADWNLVAEDLVRELKPGDFVALHGELGAGKTCLVRACLRAWGYREVVPSPSYPIILEYEVGQQKIIHVDAYRLGLSQSLPADPSEWTRAVVFVEWPEQSGIKNFKLSLSIEVLANGERRLLGTWR
jgi:tRNA threonylcarbamoyl adenosine modification protein YjeE